MRKLFSIMIFLVLALISLPAIGVAAAESGNITGSFSVGGVAPNVSALQVYSDAGCTTVATALTPQVTYFIKATVSDANTLDDIKEMKVKFYYDAGATHPDEATVTTGNEQTAAIFTWTKAGNAWAVNAGAGTTWAVVAGSSVTPSMTASSGDWIFAIKIGKAANESLAPNVWALHARATDNANLTSGFYLWGKSVLWYGEVVPITANINFGEVALGSGFGANTNKVTAISATFISNGDYACQAKSSATWAGSSGTAVLDPNGNCVNAREFALKVCSHDVFGSAALLNAVGVSIADGTRSLELGDAITTGTLWLKIASIFPADSYAGTITYTIVNR